MRDAIAPVLGSIREDAPIVATAGAGLLVDLLLQPRTRWVDHTLGADLTDALAVTGLAPELVEAWTCTEPTGNLVGIVAGGELAGGGTVYRDRSAVGLFNGSDLQSVRAVEIAQSGRFFAVSSGDYEPAAAPFAMLVAFRVVQRSAVRSTILGKWDFSFVTGWGLYLEIDGTLTWKANARTITLAGNHADGAWHVVVMYRNGTTIGLYSDVTAQNAAAGADPGSLAGFEAFALGSSLPGSSSGPLQFKLAAYFDGATLAGQRAAIVAWWDRVATRTVDTATFTRASGQGSDVGTDAEGGVVFGLVGPSAAAWTPMGNDDGAYGLAMAPAFTSLVTYSDPGDTAGWTRLNTPTVTTSAADDPRGVRGAVRLGKSASNPTGRVSAGVALASGTVYHFAVAVRWDGAGPSAPVLRVRNPADTVTEASIVATVSGRWHWLVIPPFAAAGTGTYLLQILASADTDDTAGDVLVQYASGGVGGSHVPLPALARGAGPVGVATAVSLGGILGKGPEGRIEVTARMTGVVATLPGPRGLATLSSPADPAAAERRLWIDADGDLRGATIPSDGPIESDLSSPQEVEELAAVQRWGLRWSTDGALVAITRGGIDLATAAVALGPAPDPDLLEVGALGEGGAPSWLGGVSRVRVWTEPEIVIGYIFAGAAVIAAGLAAWGWRASSAAKDRALDELEARRASLIEATATIRQLQGEVTTLRAKTIALTVQRDRAADEVIAVRVERDDFARRLEWAYELLAKAGLPGGRDRVADLMRGAVDDAGDFPPVRADRGSGDDPG